MTNSTISSHKEILVVVQPCCGNTSESLIKIIENKEQKIKALRNNLWDIENKLFLAYEDLERLKSIIPGANIWIKIKNRRFKVVILGSNLKGYKEGGTVIKQYKSYFSDKKCSRAELDRELSDYIDIEEEKKCMKEKVLQQKMFDSIEMYKEFELVEENNESEWLESGHKMIEVFKQLNLPPFE